MLTSTLMTDGRPPGRLVSTGYLHLPDPRRDPPDYFQTPLRTHRRSWPTLNYAESSFRVPALTVPTGNVEPVGPAMWGETPHGTLSALLGPSVFPEEN